MKHVNHSHAADLKADSESVSRSAAQSTRQSRITEARDSVMSKTQRDSITKDLVLNMVFKEKEPFSVFERPGFRKCIERLNPAYTPPNRVTVAAISDEIAEECLTDVKAVLTKHVADGGTICLAADAWTKKRRKFIATVAYFIVKWRLMRALISCKAVPMGQSVTAPKIVVLCPVTGHKTPRY